MDMLTTFEQKVGLPEVQQEHLAINTPRPYYTEKTTGDDETIATSCRNSVETPGLSGAHRHHKSCWRCSTLSLECCIIDQKKACDECDSGGTAQLCFGSRLEHLVDQMLNCVGEFPRVLRWDRAMISDVVISFSDCDNAQRIPSIDTLKKMRNNPLQTSWLPHNGWVEVFYNVVDAAGQYRDTNSREHTAIEKGLRCLDISLGILWAIVNGLQRSRCHSKVHTSQSLKRSDLTGFLSTLFDTTTTKPSPKGKEQLLDIFYGTLILCMIRFVLFSALRCTVWGYQPLGRQRIHDPTFLDGAKSQLYQPMLHILDYSQSRFQEGDAYHLRTAAVLNPSIFGYSAPPSPTSMSMYSHALSFINYFSQKCHTSQLNTY